MAFLCQVLVAAKVSRQDMLSYPRGPVLPIRKPEWGEAALSTEECVPEAIFRIDRGGAFC